MRSGPGLRSHENPGGFFSEMWVKLRRNALFHNARSGYRCGWLQNVIIFLPSDCEFAVDIRRKLLSVIRLDFLLYLHTITHWPLTFKTFSAMPNHVMNMCIKFHWIPSTKYGDFASRGIGDNAQTDGQTTRIRNAPRLPLLWARDAVQHG